MTNQVTDTAKLIEATNLTSAQLELLGQIDTEMFARVERELRAMIRRKEFSGSIDDDTLVRAVAVEGLSKGAFRIILADCYYARSFFHDVIDIFESPKGWTLKQLLECDEVAPMIEGVEYYFGQDNLITDCGELTLYECLKASFGIAE